jgi:hypothetical protein
MYKGGDPNNGRAACVRLGCYLLSDWHGQSNVYELTGSETPGACKAIYNAELSFTTCPKSAYSKSKNTLLPESAVLFIRSAQGLTV